MFLRNLVTLQYIPWNPIISYLLRIGCQICFSKYSNLLVQFRTLLLKIIGQLEFFPISSLFTIYHFKKLTFLTNDLLHKWSLKSTSLCNLCKHASYKKFMEQRNNKGALRFIIAKPTLFRFTCDIYGEAEPQSIFAVQLRNLSLEMRLGIYWNWAVVADNVEFCYGNWPLHLQVMFRKWLFAEELFLYNFFPYNFSIN